MTDFIVPHWQAPPHVKAAVTTRQGGVSVPPYDSLNMGLHSGDQRESVLTNCRRVVDQLQLPAEPRWLKQVHGIVVADAADPTSSSPIEADAAWTDRSGGVCAVLTADCLPVLFCDRAGTRIAAAHAGWRGLVGGVLTATVQAMGADPAELLVWLGPAIGPDVFEVGDEVRQVFIERDPDNQQYFMPSPAGRWLADLYGLAGRELAGLGIAAISGGGFCTYTDRDRFYSYRRDGAASGRMASLIWLQPVA